MKAIFLDRDGTVIVDRGYLSDPEGVAFIPGSVDALLSFRDAGFGLFFVTNQSGIGRGIVTAAQSDAVHRRTLDMLASHGVPIVASCVCPHAPWDSCSCRKPSPELMLRAALEYAIELDRSFMIGDKASDVEAGRSAGCRTILFGNAEAEPDFRSDSWTDIAQWIASQEPA